MRFKRAELLKYLDDKDIEWGPDRKTFQDLGFDGKGLLETSWDDLAKMGIVAGLAKSILASIPKTPAQPGKSLSFTLFLWT